jgi:uncharacterized protein
MVSRRQSSPSNGANAGVNPRRLSAGQMRVAVRVVPRARRTAVEPLADGGFRVTVTAPALEGQANEAVIDALAAYLRVPRSKVRIVLGQRARRKVVEIGSDV